MAERTKIEQALHELRPDALHYLVAVEALGLAWIALKDMNDYAQDFDQWLTLAIWLTTALLNVFALIGISGKQRWGAVLLLIGQASVAAFLAYVLVVEMWSPNPNLFCIIGTLVVIRITATVIREAYQASGEDGIARKIWIGIAALLPLSGVVQFWMQNVYVPRHDRPQASLVTELDELGRTGDTVHMRGLITLHNRGKVDINAIGSIYQIRTFRYASTSDDVPIEAALTGIDWRHADTGRARGLEQPGALVQADEVMTLDEFLTPGETWTKSVAFDVNAAGKDAVRLAAEAAFVTDRMAESRRVCDREQEIRIGGPERYIVQTGADRSRYICVETRFSPRNTVRDVFDDDPMIKTYVLLGVPGFPDLPLPDLDIILEAGELPASSLNQSQAQNVSEIIDRGLPIAIVNSHVEYPLRAKVK